MEPMRIKMPHPIHVPSIYAHAYYSRQQNETVQNYVILIHDAHNSTPFVPALYEKLF